MQICSTVEISSYIMNVYASIQSNERDRAVISCHMLKLKSSSARAEKKAEHNQTLQTISSDAFASVFLIPHISLLARKQSNLLLVFSILCVSTLSCPSAKAKALPSFNVLSSKMCSAIFTSCFELSCVSCPFTKQKLADLICISQLKKDQARFQIHKAGRSTENAMGLF